LAGWLTGSYALAGFGLATYPEWPIQALAILFLAAACAALATDRPRLGAPVLIVPVFVGGAALIGYATGHSTPVDGLLVSEPVRTMGSAIPGRPGLIPSVSLLLLSAALLIGHASRPERTPLTGPILGAMVLGLNLLSITVILLGFDLSGQKIRIVGSLPGSSALICLALAFWLLSGGSPGARIDGVAWRQPTRKALILLVTAPVILLPIVNWFGGAGRLSPLETGLLAATLNLLLGIVVWAWATRLADDEQRALAGLSRALDTVPVILADHEGRIVHWSEGCARLLGWRATDAVGRSVEELLTLDPVAGWPIRASPPGDRTVLELDATCRDGSRIAVLLRAEQVESSGRPLLALALTDTSMLRQTRAALQRSEATLEMALEDNHIATFDWDVASGAIGWTPGAEDRVGLPPGAMRDTETWRSLVHPDDLPDMMQTIADAEAAHAPRFGFRYRVVGPNKQVRTIEGTSHCIYDEEGALARCVGINIDVTERDEREAALAQSEARLRAIIETVPDAMIVIGEHGFVESVSATAERMFGFPRDEIVGRNVAALMPQPWAGRHDYYLGAYLTTGERKVIGRTRTLIARRKDGSEFPIELNVGEAWIGERRTFVGFVRDISERIEGEQRLADLNAAYTHSARLNAAGELAASLAHELNQPLAASANFLAAAEAMIGTRPELENVGEMLVQANGQILRAGEIIRRLRDFIAKSDTEIRIESLPTTLREALELGLTGSRQLRIETRLELDPAAELFLGDRIQVEQVVVNLVRNAAHALREIEPEQRSIMVTSHKIDKDFIAVRVADTGHGLPDHILEKLSTPFMTTKGQEGLGLGISICRRIVEAHGGALSASNRPQGGAMFEFTLPSVDQDVIGEDL